MSTEQELNEYLATEIMGWEYVSNWNYYHVSGQIQYYEENWSPFENLEQAFNLLETYTSKNNYFWRLWNDEDLEYNVSLSNPNLMQNNDKPYRNRDDTKPKAIIGAILKAESKFEKFEGVF